MTSTGRVSWPDTGNVAPPVGHRYRSATWLLGRHRQLAELVAWVPGALTGPDSDGDGPSLDLRVLAEAIRHYDAHVNAWADYDRRHPAPDDDTAYDRWVAAGPTTTPAAKALTLMSSTERTRLRLLATFATIRVPITVADFQSLSLDTAGGGLLGDWCHAVQAA